MRRIEYERAAVNDLRKLDPQVRKTMITAIERYAANGQGDVKRLRGEPFLRLRVGDWRVRFLLEHPDVMRVFGVRHRSQAYR